MVKYDRGYRMFVETGWKTGDNEWGIWILDILFVCLRSIEQG